MRTLNTERLLSSRFNDFFKPWEEWFDSGKPLLKGEWPSLTVPAVNVSEDEKTYNLSLAAPGLKKTDFKVELDGDMLIISAEKEESKEEKDEKYTREEYNYSSFCRSFTVPKGITRDKIDAHYEDGILRLALPKSEAAQKLSAKHIAVN